MMRKGIYHVILLVLLQTACMKLFAQYGDHRNRQVDSLEQVLATNPPTGGDLARIYRNLMWGYEQTDIGKSMDYARKCIEVSVSLDGWSAACNGYTILGLGFYKVSQYDSAMVYYGKALEATERMRDSRKYSEETIDDLRSSTYGNIGNLYNIQGKYHEAIEYYTKALKLFESYDDTKEQQAIAYESIGEMYRTMDNYGQAEINYLKADSLAHLAGDSLRIARTQYFLGNLYLDMKVYDKALKNAETAYGYFFSHPEEGESKAVVLNLLSQIHMDGYEHEEQAEEYAQQALALANELGIPRERAVSLSILSSIYLNRNEWHKAEQAALEALDADNTEPANTLSLYKILAKTYAHLGNAIKTNEYIDKLHELQSSWSTKHYQSAIREMEVRYDTEKKEMQITLLEDKNRLIVWLSIAGGGVLLLALTALFFLWRWTVQKKRFSEQQVKQLEQEKQFVATQAVLDGEVRERTRLARDLHDGLGSMLTGIKLHLQEMKKDVRQIDAGLQHFDKALDLLDDSVREMRRVSHHLMPDALSRFGLKPAIDDFCRSMSPQIIFDWFGNETRLDPKLEELIYRCIHELVNNAMKYSDASQIMVQIMQEPGRIAFTVQDDGCGFNPSMTTKGTGLQNIRTRVASFGGMMEINSTTGEGTEVNVELRMWN